MDSIKKREVYACAHGDYVGQMFVVVDVSKSDIDCLIIPKMENIKIPVETFNTGRNSDIIELVERLSKDIWSVCEAQYKQNTK